MSKPMIMNTEDDSMLKRFWKALFRERQIYMRTDGKVSYLPLRSYVQVLFAFLVLIILSSGAYITFNLFSKNQIIIDTNERYSVMRENYEVRLKTLSNRIKTLNKKLRTKQSLYSEQIVDLTQIYEIVESRHSEFVNLLRTNGMIDRDAVPQNGDTPNQDILNIAGEIEQSVEQFNDNVIKIYNKENKTQFLPRYIRKEVVEYSDNLIPNIYRTSIDGKIINLADIITDKFVMIGQNQIAMMDNLLVRVNDIIKDYEKTYKETGFLTKVSQIKKQAQEFVKADRRALGGPYLMNVNSDSNTFYADESNVFESELAFDNLVLSFKEKVEILKLLRLYSLRIPVRKPIIQKHRISSSFGFRVDPFRKVRAMHAGLDFAAKTGTPVYASASGVVKRAKYAGSYGLMVEIDHGNGLKTRYAHLSKVHVRKGQRIKANQVIGKVGSTGRSTGPHLHYEVRRNNNPLNPMKFLKAGKHVQEKI